MEIIVKLPKLTEPQRVVAASTARYRVVNCGRRFGKTFFGARLAAKEAIHGGLVGWFAPNYKYADEAFAFATRLLADVSKATNKSQKRIETITGGVIEVWSLDNENAGRGRKYSLAVVDEAAIVKNLERVWNYALRPTLTDLQGRALFLSTPNGLNYFHTLYQRGLDSELNWQSFHFPTSANPFIEKSEIEDARRGVPERVYRQEYLAEFLADGNYFTKVHECATVTTPDEPSNHSGHFISIGVDWALSNDYTVMTCLCRNCKRVVDWARINRVDFIRQRDRLVQLWRKWHARTVVPENNSIGAPNIEHLIKEGLPVWFDGTTKRAGFTTTALSKAQIMQALALALEQEALAVPLDYRDELLAYEVSMGSIQPRFSAPEGQHDDRVVSLALAYFGAAQPAAVFI